MSPSTILACVQEHARCSPDAPAIHYLGTSGAPETSPPSEGMIGEVISYARLESMVYVLARSMYKLLGRTGDPVYVPVPDDDGGDGVESVAICIQEGPMLVIAQLAAMSIGVPFVHIRPEYPPEYVRTLIQTVNALLIVVDTSGLNTTTRDATRAPETPPTGGDHTSESLGYMTTDTSICVIDTSTVDWNTDTQSFHPLSQCPSPSTTPTVITLTSGTTAEPKAILASLTSVMTYVSVKANVEKITHESRVFVPSLPSFDPFVADTLCALFTGACVCLAPFSITTSDLGGSLLRSRATHVCTTPGVLATCTQGPDDLPHLCMVTVGGDKMTPALARRWTAPSAAKLTLMNVYGVSEGFAYQTYHIMTSDNCDDTTCIGLPYPGVQATIQDPDPAGELILTGPQIAMGYLQRGTLYTRFRDAGLGVGGRGYYCTGDTAEEREVNGQLLLFLHGRGDRQFKVRGNRFHPGYIESVMCSPAFADVIQQCYVWAEGDIIYSAVQLESTIPCLELSSLQQDKKEDMQMEADPGQTGVSFAEEGEREREGEGERPHHVPAGLVADAAVTAIHHRCTQVLPGAAVPQRIAILPRLPLTSHGKVDAKGTRQQTHAWWTTLDDYRRHSARRALNELELVIAGVWREWLGFTMPAESLSPSDNYLSLGGDSLNAVRVIRTLHLYITRHDDGGILPDIEIDDFGDAIGDNQLTAATLLRHPVLERFASHLQQHGYRLANEGTRAQALAEYERKAPPRARVPSENELRAVYGVSQESLDMYTHLGTVVKARQPQLTRLLLLAGTPPSLQPKKTRVSHPLHFAAVHGDADSAELLLTAGAKVNATNVSYMTPAHLSASWGHVNVLECILRHGGAHKARTKAQQTLLHLAARGGHCSVLHWLVQHPQYSLRDWLDARDRWGRTALHWAALNNHLECVRTLLQLGASATPPVNVLDGVSERHGQRCFWTTNANPPQDHFDPAFLRPGRMDMIIEFTRCTPEGISYLLGQYYNKDVSPEQQAKFPDDTFTPAEIKQLCKESLNIEAAIAKCIAKPKRKDK